MEWNQIRRLILLQTVLNNCYEAPLVQISMVPSNTQRLMVVVLSAKAWPSRSESTDCYHMWSRRSCFLDQLILLFADWNSWFSRLLDLKVNVEGHGTWLEESLVLKLFCFLKHVMFPQQVHVWPAGFALFRITFQKPCAQLGLCEGPTVLPFCLSKGLAYLVKINKR